MKPLKLKFEKEYRFVYDNKPAPILEGFGFITVERRMKYNKLFPGEVKLSEIEKTLKWFQISLLKKSKFLTFKDIINIKKSIK